MSCTLRPAMRWLTRGAWVRWLGVLAVLACAPWAGAADIGGTVFIDANNDGDQDVGEEGAAEVWVGLILWEGPDPTDFTLLDSQVTGGNGDYLFDGWGPITTGETYRVLFAAPTGYVFTQSGNGGIVTLAERALEHADLTGVVALAGFTATFNPSSWEDDRTTMDCGLIAEIRIGDRVFRDSDGDGIQDGAEGGVAGVTVKLLQEQASYVVIDTAQTDGDGLYQFSHLYADNYKVEIILPNGFRHSPQDQGADDTLDSDVSTTTGRTAARALVSGNVITDMDAGLIPLARIEGYIFLDDDTDGVQDTGEAGKSNVVVHLYDPVDGVVNDGNDVELSNTTTDGDGVFVFANLQPGEYFLLVDLPTGFTFSPMHAGSSETDSDVDPANGLSSKFTLGIGTEDTTRDVGMYAKAYVGGRVFLDADGDGVQDADEGETDGTVAVTLYKVGADGTAGTSDDVAIGSQNTVGEYLFGSVDPGHHYLKFTLPSGLMFSPTDRGGDDTLDSDANPSDGRTTVFLLRSGMTDRSWDAGAARAGWIGGTVFGDLDSDSVKAPDEEGVTGVAVTLYDAGVDGAIGGGDDSVAAAASTDEYGDYTFQVIAGTYYLQFAAPTGASFSLQDVGDDDNVDSDVDPSTGQTSVFTLYSNKSILTYDAGLLGVGGGDTLTGDTDFDGVPDSIDNCIHHANPDQADIDNDGIGDACDGTNDIARTVPVESEDDDADSGDDAEEDAADDDSTGDFNDEFDPYDPRTADTTDDDDEITDPGEVVPPGCGACAPLGMVSYTLWLAGYGAFLTQRRRSRAGRRSQPEGE